MKKILVTIFLFSSLGVAAQSAIEQAAATAKAANKKILLLFSGSDWCIPCMRMEKAVFEKEAFLLYAKEKLVLVQADFPRLKKHRLPPEQQKENEALAEKYNQKGAFPFIVLLDADGKVLKEWEGEVAGSAQNFITQLEAVPHAD